MSRKLDLVSKVRVGMNAERSDVDARLRNSGVVESAQANAANILNTGPQSTAEEASTRLSPDQPDDQRIHVLSIDDCIANPYNPRAFYSPQSIDALAATLQREQQLQPIIFTHLPEYPGKNIVVDGERRKRALKSLGRNTVLGMYRPDLSPQDLFTLAYRANKERDAQTVFDDAVSWQRLLTQGVYRDQLELAAAVGEDKIVVNKVLQLNTLPMSLLQRMVDNAEKVKLSHAYNIKLICDKAGDAVAERWLDQVIAGQASVRKLEQIATSDKSGARGAKRTHYESRVKFASPSGFELGELKAFADGRAELNLKGVKGVPQEQLIDKLTAVIQSWALELTDDDVNRQVPETQSAG
ncbi:MULTISPECIES: ParB/RepB/Spo0J family partition protein [unclassified Burkholderia]|uniref:ParB/RepB/Spo0J family partition protein n=1 Tax=unclassified Burkholderia TaxID=2613784 RepID=UPI00142347FB|nr:MULTISPECIES: ParB/RepB/Spo0J family partition protein [unclassified Burkholderia]NIE81924.1 ParB/RepB/Spo0J family partition protein [Burkholderia sp. Tr-860]NIF61112.1 ParB/RepB/Spo0J family partition protein [Burkholderia sp. Cy-647]NIF94015.1 ParB/RepB/Spo0J family partition protein [Burkholderia sp. Ax-1720]